MKHPCKTEWGRKWLALDVTHPDLNTAASTAESYCGRWFRNYAKDSLLVLVGGFGCGKTHIAKRIEWFCAQAAFKALASGHWGSESVPSVFYISWPEEVSAFNEKKYGIMEDAFGADLLVLDDVGAESDPFKTRVGIDRLCQILSRREKRFTVLTTNVAVSNWVERFDGRINDRLFRNSIIMDLSRVPSYAIR